MKESSAVACLQNDDSGCLFMCSWRFRDYMPRIVLHRSVKTEDPSQNSRRPNVSSLLWRCNVDPYAQAFPGIFSKFSQVINECDRSVLGTKSIVHTVTTTLRKGLDDQ